MLKKSPTSVLKNEKGMAIFEIVPILIIIVLFINFSLGFFGAIHTGILNSIAARNYAFETFRFRSNLSYFRNVSSSGGTNPNYDKTKFRTHGIGSDKKMGSNTWYATTRLIDFMNFQPARAADQIGAPTDHNKSVRDLAGGRNEKVGVNPIWIRTAYGICLDSNCGTAN